MPEFATLITFRELTGTEPSLDQLRTTLAPFGLHSVLTGMARLTALLGTWQNDVDLTRDRQLCQQHLPSYSPVIERLRALDRNRVALTRLSILFVLKQACLVCPLDGQGVSSPDEVERVLSCCLMANDLLVGRAPPQDPSTLETAASLLPFSDYLPQDCYPKDMARSVMLFEDIGPALASEPGFIDLGAEFQASVGVAPREFSELAFCAALRFVANIEQQFQSPGDALVLRPQFFQQTAIPLERVAAFLQRLAVPEAALAEHVGTRRDSDGDFTLFQQYPLVQFAADSFLCLDPGFMLDKAGRSLYWTLHASFDRTRRADLMSFWGRVYERYVAWLFEQSYQGRGRWVFSPRFPDGVQAFDGCLLEGSSLVVFEFKASILSVAAKYGFDADRLGVELKEKVIEGTPGRPKGLEQLRRSLLRFLDGEEIDGLGGTTLKKIYPVMVFWDQSFAAPCLGCYYNENFDRVGMRKRGGPAVTPVFTLTIADLENVLPHTIAHCFTDVLDSYWRANRPMVVSLSTSNVPLLHDGLRGRDPVGDRFSRFSDELQRRLFPNDLE